jgi:hypothetical protein
VLTGLPDLFNINQSSNCSIAFLATSLSTASLLNDLKSEASDITGNQFHFGK